MQTNVQIDTKGLRHSPEHGKGGKGGNRYTAETSNLVSNVWNNRLSYAMLDFYPLTECQEVYSKEFVTQKNFCAGFFSKGGGACNRDAGGPGVAYGKLYGVVSFGAPNCGAPDAPTVFTKLGFYAEWIEGIIEMDVPTVTKSTTKQTPQETWNADSFVMSTKPRFKIAPVTKSVVTLSTPVPIEDALRTHKENELFKEFLKTMFGSEEVKEYLDQYDSDTDIETQQKSSTKDFSRSFIVKPIAETTTEANIEERSFDDLEVSQDVHEGSVKMATIIENFEDPVVKSEEEDATTRKDTTPMHMKMDVNELAEQNIAKLIHDIDVQELLESVIAKSSGEKANPKPKPKHKKPKRSKIKRNKAKIRPKKIKLITDKIKPIDVKSSNDKIKQKERKRTTDKIKPKKQTSQKEEKIEVTIESASENVKESETNDDYTEESGDDDDYDIYHSDGLSLEILEKAREVTFRQNSTATMRDSFSHEDLLKLLHEVVAEVVESATSKQYTKGTIVRR